MHRNPFILFYCILKPVMETLQPVWTRRMGVCHVCKLLFISAASPQITKPQRELPAGQQTLACFK